MAESQKCPSTTITPGHAQATEVWGLLGLALGPSRVKYRDKAANASVPAVNPSDTALAMRTVRCLSSRLAFDAG